MYNENLFTILKKNLIHDSHQREKKNYVLWSFWFLSSFSFLTFANSMMKKIIEYQGQSQKGE